MKELNLALVISRGRPDGLAQTIIDGFYLLNKQGDYKIKLEVSYGQSACLSEPEFIDFARKADLIILTWGKDNTDVELVDKIGAWNKTVFIDGSELGGNRRLDKKIMKEVSTGSYKGAGSINFELLNKCVGYFRREPPYLSGVNPLPFGIDSSYIRYKDGVKKNIDFVCIFGQEDYPPLRREVRQALEKFCKENNFSYRTKQTKLPFLSAQSSFSKKRFYSLLARTKVGVSVSGGGYDTLRFWEILANNCILLTETVGIYPPDSNELSYKRIWQFSDLASFEQQLELLGRYLKSDYNLNSMDYEHSQILKRHSSKARAEEILRFANGRRLI